MLFPFIDEQQQQRKKNNGAGDNNHHFSCLWFELFRHFSPCRLQPNQSLSVLRYELTHLSDFCKQSDGVHFNGKSNAPYNLYFRLETSELLNTRWELHLCCSYHVFFFRFSFLIPWSSTLKFHALHTHTAHKQHTHKLDVLCAILYCYKSELKSWWIYIDIDFVFVFVDFKAWSKWKIDAFTLSLALWQIGKRNSVEKWWKKKIKEVLTNKR